MPNRKTHYFSHEAMATSWEFGISHADASEAESAARASFREIDHLEDLLSRFREYSDIGRINCLSKNEPLVVSPEAMECLELAHAVWEESGGAFDITIGPVSRLWITPDGYPCLAPEEALAEAAESCGMDKVVLDPGSDTVMLLADNMILDLGGIGKGYALDKIAVYLRDEWEIENALLDAGNSTILALGNNGHDAGWLVNAGDEKRDTLLLTDAAISASGFEVKGVHIIDPRTHRPVMKKQKRSWASATSAALSDALSTAFMVMDPKEIDQLCARYDDVRAILL